MLRLGFKSDIWLTGDFFTLIPLMRYFTLYAVLVVMVLGINRDAHGLTVQDTVYTVENLPNPRADHNGYVSDPDGLLQDTTVAAIDRLLRQLEDSTSIQVAVVAVRSIGDADIFDFSQRLFNTWGIGQARSNNGLLVLLVTDQRTVRFHTGQGIQGILTDVVTKRIQREYMVPYFKENDYSLGMSEGLRISVRLLMDNAFRESWYGLEENEDSAPLDLYGPLALAWLGIALIAFLSRLFTRRSEKGLPDERIGLPAWIIYFVVVPEVIFWFTGTSVWMLLFLYLYVLAHAVWRYRRIRNTALRVAQEGQLVTAWGFLTARQRFPLYWAFIFPLPFSWMANSLYRFKKEVRNGPLKCSTCGSAMRRCSETDDDAYLSAGKRLEEQIGTVDYDVWICTSCTRQEVLPFLEEKAGFEQCDSCGNRTFELLKREIINTASQTLEGLEAEHWKCRFCSAMQTREIIIPMLASSSSGDSDSSSDSSSGSDFGGGSSDGGGSSSSW